jgi:hypothetical protein
MVQCLLKRAAFSEAYELVMQDVAKSNLATRTQHLSTRRDQD